MQTKKRPGAPTLDLASSISKLTMDAPEPEQQLLDINDVVKDSKYKFSSGQFESLKKLGAGAGGQVCQVRHKPTNQIMAQKVYLLMGKKQKKAILRELKILKQCASPYVIGFYGAYIDNDDIHIMMEFMDCGALDSLYQRKGPFPEHVCISVCWHVLNGLIYLFDEFKIVHRDIKPSNILMSSKGLVKISDFGVSKELNGTTMARTFTGTQGYLAPERIQANGNVTTVSDVWSVGLTLIEIATTVFPLPEEATAGVMDLLNYIRSEPSPSLPPGRFSEGFNYIVNQSLIKDPNQRPTPKQLLVLILTLGD
ncbi:kinase-like domain-containing protein [Gorgonomyces haynaldii]|nr:kinase-like domain-containing protein [Gorgonomyces haynaldii]